MDLMNCCRICIQSNNDMRSIYEIDICGKMKIVDKIIICANITAKNGKNIPENICLKCLEDLHIAYRFKMNCETAETILKSICDEPVITDLIMSSDNGEVFKYEPPKGLRVKRIIRGQIENQLQQITTIKSEVDLAVGGSSSTNIEEEDETIFFNTHDYEDDNNDYLEDDKDDYIDNNDGHIANEEYINNVPQQMKIEYLEHDHESTQDFIPEQIVEYDDDLPSKVEEQQEEEQQQEEQQQEEQQQEEQQEEPPQEDNILSPKSIKQRKGKNKIIKTDKGGKSKNEKSQEFRGRKSQTDELKSLKICDICGNTYKYKHALESHMRRHRNEKPFSCEICNRSFVINFELRRHMRTHTGQKPYACQFCERRFSDFGSRIKHERTHTGERPYTCETCGKSFAYSHVLSSHVLIHTGEKRFGCDECGKKFTKSHHLKAHKNTHWKTPKNIWLDPYSTTVILDSGIVEKNDGTVMIENTNDVMNVLETDNNQTKMENHPCTTMLLDDEDIKIIYN